MNSRAPRNSSHWMNWVAGVLPRGFSGQGPPGQPASGSGKTAPSAAYEPASVATGVAGAVLGTRSAPRSAARGSRRRGDGMSVHATPHAARARRFPARPGSGLAEALAQEVPARVAPLLVAG